MIKIEDVELLDVKKLIDVCTSNDAVVQIDDTGRGYTVHGMQGTHDTWAIATYEEKFKELYISIMNPPYHIKEDQIKGLIQQALHG